MHLPEPPAEHPRLYLRARDAAQLSARLHDPVLRSSVARLEAMAKRSAQYRVEWDAVHYLVQPDAARGRAIIDETLELLKGSDLVHWSPGQRPDQTGGCRITGRMMVTGAIVYDWLYPLLTDADKQAFIAELVRLAKTQECGYPPTRGGAITGHGTESMMWRDILSAGIAIYDEYPEMYQLVAGRLFREHIPARNWFYPGHAHHQGDSYGPYRYQWDTFALFIFDRLGAGNVFTPEQQFVPYYWLYATRPDGQRLRNGDTFRNSKPRGTPWNEELGPLLTASYYGDGVLLSQFLRQGGASDDDELFEFLWRDPSLAPQPIDALPLSRYFGSPFGWTIARTNWDSSAVIAEMKVNEYNFNNHQHLDAGSFQIYYDGALAIASGLYRKNGLTDGYASPHAKNYYWRSIATNTLLVYDPEEDFGKGLSNDGGQRVIDQRHEPRTLPYLLDPANGYHTGRVLAHGFGPVATKPDYTLLQGDITDAYGAKVRNVTRSFVFLNLRNAAVPAALIAFDRVVSADPAFRKYWLMHTIEEPSLAATSATVDRTEHGEKGRLNLDVLLPDASNVSLEKVGGPGREYWVFGTNYANDIDPATKAKGSIESGAWRIELSPKQPAAENFFLNVMQVTDRTKNARWPVRRLDFPERVGCVLNGPDATWAVVLRKDSRRSAQDVQLTIDGDAPCHVLVADLTPGRWQATHAGDNQRRTFDVSAESGAGWFEGPAGAWTIQKTN
jgi:heparin/heparan-sulfate lyase